MAFALNDNTSAPEGDSETLTRLRESERRLQLALSAGRGIGTWDWDVRNDRVVSDERFARLYGVDPEHARRGAPVGALFQGIHPDDLPRVQVAVQSALRTGELFSEEYRLRKADGVTRWVLAEGRWELAPDGSPTRFVGISFDISERKATEIQLRDLNAELERKVIERTQARGRTSQVSPDLLGALNSQGYFETSNPAWMTVLGWTEAEVSSMSIFELLHPRRCQGGTETILVAEDDSGVREAAVALLRDLGYRVLEASNGDEALQMIRSGAPVDLLFTDVVMPGAKRSTDVVKEGHFLLPHMAVLYTSGYAEGELLKGGRLDTDVLLLSKPYTAESLARHVRQALALSIHARIGQR